MIFLWKPRHYCWINGQILSLEQNMYIVQIRYSPNKGHSCCLAACPPDIRSPAQPPPEGSGCCTPCCEAIYSIVVRSINCYATDTCLPHRQRSHVWTKSRGLQSDDVRCPGKDKEISILQARHECSLNFKNKPCPLWDRMPWCASHDAWVKHLMVL